MMQLNLPQPIWHGAHFHASDLILGPARWPHHDLVLTHRGRVRIEVEGTPYLCCSGDALLVPQEHRFVGYPDSEGAFIQACHFSWAGSETLAIALDQPIQWPGALLRAWPRTIASRIRRAFNQERAADSTEIPLLLSLLLTDFAKSDIGQGVNHKVVRRIRQAIEWIEASNYPAPSTAEVATQIDWSVSQFRLRFSEVMGLPFGEWMRRRSFDEAARLLQESEAPIKHIAEVMGYSDVVAFHRAFRNHEGRTPAQYRKQMRSRV